MIASAMRGGRTTRAPGQSDSTGRVNQVVSSLSCGSTARICSASWSHGRDCLGLEYGQPVQNPQAYARNCV